MLEIRDLHVQFHGSDHEAVRGIDLTVSPEAAAHLASDGFDPVYGARPLRRAIQHQVEDSLSEEVLSGRIRLGDRVECYLDDGKLAFRKVSE